MTIVRVPVDLQWSIASGSPGVNVWHARYDGPFTGSDQMAGLLDNLRDFYDALAGIFTNDFTATFAGEVTGLGPDEGSTASYDTWQVEGLGGTESLPPEVQALISWKTGSGGRRGRGRTFLGPLSVNQASDNGTWLGGGGGAAQAAVNDFIASWSGIGDGAWGVYSRADGLVRDIQIGTTQSKFSVLRSRRD